MADNSPSSGGTGDTIASDDVGGVKYQRVKLVYGADGSVQSDVEATNPYPISVNAANFIFSTANTTVVQLASGAAFTGTIESALNQPCISLLLTCDQDCFLEVQQYIDIAGTFAVPDIDFTIKAGVQFSRSLVLNGNYVRVKLTNLGNAPTTKLNLNVAYGTIQPATARGNLPVSIDEIGGTTIAGSVPVTIKEPIAGVATRSQSLDDAAAGAWPLGHYIQGDPRGPLADLSLLDEWFLGTFAPSISNDDLPRGGLNKGQLAADMQGPIAGSVTSLAFNGGVLGVIETTGYKSIAIEVGAGAGSVIIEGTNLGGIWGQIQYSSYSTSNSNQINGGAIPFTAIGPAYFQVPATFRFIRVRLTVFTSGTPTMAAYLRNIALSFGGIGGTQVVSGTVTATSTQPFTPTALFISSAASTNATSVKASAGTVYNIHCANSGAAAVFVKLHNSATAPTVGTTPVTDFIPIPASGQANFDCGVLGMRFSTGIALSITNLIADTDATAVALNQVKVSISYV